MALILGRGRMPLPRPARPARRWRPASAGVFRAWAPRPLRRTAGVAAAGVADRDREGVGGVVGRGRLRQAEQGRDHPLTWPLSAEPEPQTAFFTAWGV